MKLLACMILGCFALVQSQTVTNHTHFDRGEFDSFNFAFDGSTGLMCVLSGTNCYIWQLTEDERQSIHTDDGLRQTEIRVLTEINDAYYTVIPKAVLHPSLIHSCSYKTHSYFLVH